MLFFLTGCKSARKIGSSNDLENLPLENPPNVCRAIGQSGIQSEGREIEKQQINCLKNGIPKGITPLAGAFGGQRPQIKFSHQRLAR